MAEGLRAQLDWNLVRTFVAVATNGSLTGAARELGLAHPTVARHIQTLEAQLGLLLFDRTHQGMALNSAGSRLAQQAAQMRREALAFEQLTDAVREQPLPRIRITMAELLVELVPALLSRSFEALRADKTQFELIVAEEQVNLLERGADIALRHVRPTQQDLIARKIGVLAMTGYATADYLARFGPVTAENLAAHRFIDDASVGRFVKGAASVGLSIPEEAVVVRSDSLICRRAAMAAGLGITALPEPMAATMEEVLPVFGTPAEGVALDVWLVARSDMRHNNQVRSTFERLGETFTQLLPGAVNPPLAADALV